MALNGSFMSINSFPNGVDRSIGLHGHEQPIHRAFLLPQRVALQPRGRPRRRNRDTKVNYLAYIRMPACTNRSLVFLADEATALSFAPGIERIENGIPTASCGTRPCLRPLSTDERRTRRTIGIIDFCF